MYMQNSAMKGRRRELRRKSTPAEKKLWDALKLFRWENMPFRRQYSVDWYVLDFYCPKFHLAVEVDGPIHDRVENQGNDKVREDWLKSQSITILRFSNESVMDHLSQVLEKIKDSLKSPSPDHGGKGI
jgi:very-short-patch-repair endonuclease